MKTLKVEKLKFLKEPYMERRKRRRRRERKGQRKVRSNNEQYLV